MKETILPFPICSVLWGWWLWSLLAQHSRVSQPVLALIAEIWHWPKLPLAAAEQVCLGRWRGGWGRMPLVSEGFLLPRTHRVGRHRLRQSCTLEFSWEAEPLAKGTGYLQVKCVWKVLQELHLHIAIPSSCSPLSIQCWYPNSSLSEDCALWNSVNFCNTPGSLWVSVLYIFFRLCGKRFINSEGRCFWRVALQKRCSSIPDNWFFQEAISPALCCACTQLVLNSILEALVVQQNKWAICRAVYTVSPIRWEVKIGNIAIYNSWLQPWRMQS